MCRSETVTYVLAMLGDARAQYGYGDYLNKQGKKAEALMWMSRAADGYDTRAMVWMGLAYGGGGYFVQADEEMAFHFFKEAAERNEPTAMMMLASMFEDSAWVKAQVKPEEARAAAMVWYMRAAQNGVGSAIDRLVKVYENGELGEIQDKEKADMWRKTPRKTDEYWQQYMES